MQIFCFQKVCKKTQNSSHLVSPRDGRFSPIRTEIASVARRRSVKCNRSARSRRRAPLERANALISRRKPHFRFAKICNSKISDFIRMRRSTCSYGDAFPRARNSRYPPTPGGTSARAGQKENIEARRAASISTRGRKYSPKNIPPLPPAHPFHPK